MLYGLAGVPKWIMVQTLSDTIQHGLYCPNEPDDLLIQQNKNIKTFTYKSIWYTYTYYVHKTAAQHQLGTVIAGRD